MKRKLDRETWIELGAMAGSIVLLFTLTYVLEAVADKGVKLLRGVGSDTMAPLVEAWGAKALQDSPGVKLVYSPEGTERGVRSYLYGAYGDFDFLASSARCPRRSKRRRPRGMSRRRSSSSPGTASPSSSIRRIAWSP